MRRFQSFLSAAAVLSIGLIAAASTAVAQEHLIGEGQTGQTANRVIKLQSSASAKPVQVPAAVSNKTSRVVQAPISVAQAAIQKAQAAIQNVAKPVASSGAPKVQFDDITSVPSVLQGTQGMQQRVTKRPTTSAFSKSINVQGSQDATDWVKSKQKPSYDFQSEGTNSEAVSISKKAPMINSMIEAPGYINLNQTATMRIKLQNVGNASAGQVKLIATLPPHAKFVRAIPNPTSSEGQVYEFTLTNLGMDQVREVAIDLVPTEKAPLDIGTEIVVENTQRFAVGVREPKLTISLKGPTKANMGQVVKHEIVLENKGDGIAEDIHIRVKYPEGIQADKTNDKIVIPALEPGRTLVVDLGATARTPCKADLEVEAEAKGIELQTASTTITVHKPELEVSAVGPKMNFVNREGIYTLKLNNTGQVDVSNVNLMLQVPAGMEVTTISREASVDSESGVLVWSFDKIEANTEQLVQLKTLATMEGQQICSIAVRSNETRDKEIKLSTIVATRADLNVSIKNESGPIQVGNQAQFLVSVENKGSSSANDVTVNIELPESLKSVKRQGAEVAEIGNTVTFKDAQIEPGQTREFVFTTVGSVKGEHVVRSVLQASGSERKIIVEGIVYVYEVSETRVSEALSPMIR